MNEYKLWLTGIFYCGHKIVAQYAESHGRYIFAHVLDSDRPETYWTKEFNTAEATKFYKINPKKEPDLTITI